MQLHIRPQQAYNWTETKSSNVICVDLSLIDPKTKLFVNGHMLKRRQRMLNSFPVIVLYPNSKYTYTYRFKRGFLEHLCYRFASKPVFWKKLGLSLGPTDNLDDCFQLAIVDGGEGGGFFVDKLAEL